VTWDFDGIKQEIKDRLSLLSNWTNTLYYGAYDRIIDIIAYIINKLVNVIFFYYRESTWTTATLLDTLIRECELLSYSYHRRKGAVGEIIISSDPTFNISYSNSLKTVVIPRWSLFTNTAVTSNVYCTDETTYIKNYIGNKSIPVKEGIPRTYLYTAEGITDEVIYLAPSDVTYGIDNDEINIYMAEADGTILSEVSIEDNLYFLNDLVNYYCTVKNVPDFSTVNITFGDGIKSSKLNVGQYVLIKYAETLGDQGNIQSSGEITEISSTLYDSDGTDVTDLLYVTNEESISDGSDYEDIESIRNNAPNLFQTGYRLGSIGDWQTTIDSISYVNKAAVWTVEDVGGSTVISEQNTVYVTAVSSTGDDLTTAQQTEIEIDYLKEKKSPTETVTWNPLEKIYTAFDVSAKISNLTTAEMITNIKDAISDAYGVLNVGFQENIYESAYIKTISDIPNIVYHNTTLDNMEKNISKNSSNVEILPSYLSSDTIIEEDQVLLVSETMKLWIKEKMSSVWGSVRQIGREISGVIQNLIPSSFTITGGTVNLLANTYNFNITSATGSGVIDTGTRNPGTNDPNGYLLYLTYQTKDGNDTNQNCIRLPRRYQITDVDEDFITTSLTYI